MCALWCGCTDGLTLLPHVYIDNRRFSTWVFSERSLDLNLLEMTLLATATSSPVWLFCCFRIV